MPSPIRGQAVRSTECEANRRGLLIGGITTAVAPLILVRDVSAGDFLEVSNLSSFQRSDQKKEFIARAQAVLREVLTAEDSPTCIRLALHDAGTYDIVSKTGGFDGSIATSSQELGLPENATLAALVKKLAAAKDTIDAGDKNGAGKISWADTIYLAARVSTQRSWGSIKLGRAKTESGGNTISTAFSNEWPAEIGRVDAPNPGPNRVPALDADVATIRAYLLQLGTKPGAGTGPFDPKPLFWDKPGFLIWTAAALDPAAEEARFVAAFPDVYTGIKRGFDISRKTVTRTDYEVDFAAIFNKLCRLGATFNPDAYLYRVPFKSIL